MTDNPGNFNFVESSKSNNLVNSRILIVDDDESICAILAEFLEDNGTRCIHTSNSNKAAERIEHEVFDVVLSDIYMPGLSGHDLLSLTLKHAPSTPFILMTGRPSLDNTIDAIRLGAYDYLVKPFNLDVVLLTIERALNYRMLSLENLAYQQNLERQVDERTQELKDFMFHAVQSLARALEARDPYTEGHGYRVSVLLTSIAEELGIDQKHHTALKLAAQLHDIGKIGIPDNILQKKGKLTYEEYVIMKRHVQIGYNILSPIPSLHEVARYVYEHHERVDGNGYPRGLKGDQIHFHSRILQATEVFDALATKRVYKPAWPLDEIKGYFSERAGTEFDEVVVDGLIKVLERNGHAIMSVFENAETGLPDKKEPYDKFFE